MDSTNTSQLTIHRISFTPIKAASKSYCEVNVNEISSKRIEGKLRQDSPSFTYNLDKFSIPVNLNTNDDITISIFLPKMGITSPSGSISIPIKELIHEGFFAKPLKLTYDFKVFSKKNVDRGDGTIHFFFKGNQLLKEILESPKLLKGLDYILEVTKTDRSNAIFEKDIFQVLVNILKALLPKSERKKSKSSKKDLQIKDKDKSECKKKIFVIFKSLFISSNINKKATFIKNGIFKLIVVMLSCDDKSAILNSLEYLKNFFTSISHQNAMIKDGVLHQLLKKLKSDDDIIVPKVFDILMYFEESLMNEFINAGILDLLIEILSKGSISIKLRSLELCKNLVKSYQDEIILSGITDVISDLLKDLIEKRNEDLFHQILLFINLFNEEKLSTFNPKITNYILAVDSENIDHFELGLSIIEKFLSDSQEDNVEILNALNIYYNSCDNVEKKPLIFQLVLKLSRREDLLSSIKESGFLEILLMNSIEAKDPQAIKEFLSWFISLNISSGKILSFIHPHIFTFVDIGRETSPYKSDIIELSLKLCVNVFENIDKSQLINTLSDLIDDRSYNSITLFKLMLDLYEKLLHIDLSLQDKNNLIVSLIGILKQFYFYYEIDEMKRFFKCFFSFENWKEFMTLQEFRDIYVCNNFNDYREEIMKILQAYARDSKESECFNFVYTVSSMGISREELLSIIKEVPNYIQSFTSSNIFSNLKNQLSNKGGAISKEQLENFYYVFEYLINHKETMQNNGIIECLIASINKWPELNSSNRLFQTFVEPDICVKKGHISDMVNLLLISHLSSWIIEHILMKVTKTEDLSKILPRIVENVIKLIEVEINTCDIYIKYLKLLFSKDSKYKNLCDSATLIRIIQTFLEATEGQDIKFGIEFLEDYINSNEPKDDSAFESIVTHLLFLLTSPIINFKSDIVRVIKLIPQKSYMYLPDFNIMDNIDLLEKRYFKDIGIFTDYLSIYNFMEISRLIDGHNYIHFSFDSFLNLVGFSTLGSFILSYEKFLISIPTRENDVLGIYYNNNSNKGFLFFKKSVKLPIEYHPIHNIDIIIDENTIQFGPYISINTLSMEILTDFDDTNFLNASPTYILEDMRLYSISPSLKPYNTYQINVSDLNDPLFAGLKTDEIMSSNSKDTSLRHIGTIIIRKSQENTYKRDPGLGKEYLNQTVARFINRTFNKDMNLQWTITPFLSFNGIYSGVSRILLMEGEEFLFAVCMPSGRMHIGKHELKDIAIISFKSPTRKEPVIIQNPNINIPVKITKDEIFIGEGTDLYINLSYPQKSFSNLGFSFILPLSTQFMTDKAHKFLTGKNIGWKVKGIYMCEITSKANELEQQQPNFDIISLMIFTLKFLPPDLQSEIIDYLHSIFKLHSAVQDNLENIINTVSLYLDNNILDRVNNFIEMPYNINRATTTINNELNRSKYYVKIHDMTEDGLITNIFVRIRNPNLLPDSEYLMYIYASKEHVDTHTSINIDSKYITDSYIQVKSNYNNKLKKYDNRIDKSDPIFGDVLEYLNIKDDTGPSNILAKEDKDNPIAINYIHRGMNEFILIQPIHAKTLILYTPSLAFDLDIEVIPIYIKDTPESLPLLPISRCNLIPGVEINTRRRQYVADFDENGILFYIGTRNSVNWINPLINNEVDVTLSHFLFSTAMSKNNVIGRDVRENTYWGGTAPQYFILNLKKYKAKITHYTIRHGYSLDNSFVHNFTLEGSNDRIVWEQLHAVVVSPFSHAFQAHTFKLNRSFPFYQYFKFTQKGNYAMRYNEQVGSGAPYLCIGGFELYGDVVEIL